MGSLILVLALFGGALIYLAICAYFILKMFGGFLDVAKDLTEIAKSINQSINHKGENNENDKISDIARGTGPTRPPRSTG